MTNPGNFFFFDFISTHSLSAWILSRFAVAHLRLYNICVLPFTWHGFLRFSACIRLYFTSQAFLFSHWLFSRAWLSLFDITNFTSVALTLVHGESGFWKQNSPIGKKRKGKEALFWGLFFHWDLRIALLFSYTAPSLAVLIEFCAIGELLIFVMAFFEKVDQHPPLAEPDSVNRICLWTVGIYRWLDFFVRG